MLECRRKGADRTRRNARQRPASPLGTSRSSDINGTRWNFELLVAYDFSRHLYAELTHYSHGSELGIRRDVPNAGWDFVGLGYAF